MHVRLVGHGTEATGPQAAATEAASRRRRAVGRQIFEGLFFLFYSNSRGRIDTYKESNTREVSFWVKRVFFVHSSQCRRSAGEHNMKLVVHSMINRYVLSATVVHSNALLRFRFERPLNPAFVQPGREITVLECEFSKLGYVVNCRRVKEPDVMLTEHAVRPRLV